MVNKNEIDNLKFNVNVSSVIEMYINIRKFGTEYKAICPFHEEKTPSFTINDNKHFYHCFGCGAHGDIFKFIMEYEGKSFIDAVRIISSKFNIPVEIDNRENNLELYQLMNKVQKLFHSGIAGNKEIVSYLESRGINSNIINEFGIGFSCRLEKLLSNKELKIAISLGLLRENYGKLGNFLFDRITVPIRDSLGRVISFGARSLRSNIKYLNTKDSPIFKKKSTLFNINNLNTQIKRVIIVEGYFDSIVMSKFGFGNTIASMGTSLTNEQICHVLGKNNEVIILFDSDNAGVKSLSSSIARSILPNIKPGDIIKIAQLPRGYDPDSFLRNFGADKMQRLLNDSTILSQFLWENEVKKVNYDMPEYISVLSKRINSMLLLILDEDSRKGYKIFFNRMIYRLPFDKYKRNKIVDIHEVKLQGRLVNAIRILFLFPELLEKGRIEEEFISIDEGDLVLEKMKSFVIESFNESKDSEEFKQNIYKNEPIRKIIDSNTINCVSLLDAEKKWSCLMRDINITRLTQEYEEVIELLKKNPDDKSLESRLIMIQEQLQKNKFT